MTIEVGEAAFARGLADVDAGADRLRADRDRVGRQVTALLDGDWHGTAATAFGRAFDGWLRGAQDVLEGLEAMGELMRAAQVALDRTDAGSAALLRTVSARIVERLS